MVEKSVRDRWMKEVKGGEEGKEGKGLGEERKERNRGVKN